MSPPGLPNLLVFIAAWDDVQHLPACYGSGCMWDLAGGARRALSVRDRLHGERSTLISRAGECVMPRWVGCIRYTQRRRMSVVGGLGAPHADYAQMLRR